MLLEGPVQMQHLYVTKDLDCKDQISEQCSIQFVDKGVNFGFLILIYFAEFLLIVSCRNLISRFCFSFW